MLVTWKLGRRLGPDLSITESCRRPGSGWHFEQREGAVVGSREVPPGLVLWGFREREEKAWPCVAQRAGDHPTPRRELSYKAV